MEYEELKQQIELFFNQKASAEAVKGLERFKSDGNLLNILGANLQGKDMRQVQIEHFSTLVDAIEGVVNATYPVENPVQYSPLYISALKNNRVPRFKNILKHLNIVTEIDAKVTQIGISINPDRGQRQNYPENAEYSFLFDSTSYLALMKKIQDDRDADKAPLEKRLHDFELHLKELAESGFKPSDLLANNYGLILDYFEVNAHGPEPNIFEERAKTIHDIIKSMDAAGFKVEDKTVITQIYNWATARGDMLGRFQKLSQYLSQEALMYMSGFHLKTK